MKLSPTKFLCALLVVLGVFATRPAQAQEDNATLAKIVDLNKRALAANDGSDFEEAAKLLKQALELADAENLLKHPIAARTHIHLGVVYVAGLKRRDLGIEEFKQALTLDPNIKVTKSLVTPEIEAAFGEASTAMGVATEGTNAGTGKAGSGLLHPAVTKAPPGAPISIKVRLDMALAADKVMLAYKSEDMPEFLAREMIKEPTGWHRAQIPAEATNGSSVSYYIEAQNGDGQALASHGSAASPHVIKLDPDAPAVGDGNGAVTPEAPKTVAKPVEPTEPVDGGKKNEGGSQYWLSLTAGVGGGYVSATPEANGGAKISGGQFAPLMNIAPEVGYFLDDTTLLSLQGRVQIVSGGTEHVSGATTQNPAKVALAVLGKLTWFFGESDFHPYVSVAAGAGQIRYVVKVPYTDCGASGNQQCKDTLAGGSFLLGGSAGFSYSLSDSVAFLLGLNVLAGVPNVALNADLNLGIATYF